MAKNGNGANAKRPLSKREKGLVAGIAAALVVAVAAVAVAVVLPTGGSDAPDGAAAKVNDSYIYEEDVAEWIEQYRITYSLEDDDDFLDALSEDDENAAMFRITVINQLALSLLINQTAEELGVTPSDEEAQEQIDALKQSLAFGDDDIWTETLESYGMTEEGLLAQYKTNLAEEAICEAVVEYRDPYDSELLSYIQSYLAGTTQKHAYYIVFEVNDDETVEACQAELEALEEAGELTVDTFSDLAVEYSVETDVESTGGSYAWSGGNMSDEAKEALEDVEVGSYSEATTVTTSDDVEYVQIYFCDEEYTFADASDMDELPDDVPDELMDEISEATAEAVYESNCNSYLAWLLASAEITYYPIPQDASYNVTAYTLTDDEDAGDDAEEDGDSTDGGGVEGE